MEIFFFREYYSFIKSNFILNKGFIDKYSSNDKKILKLNNKNEGE